MGRTGSPLYLPGGFDAAPGGIVGRTLQVQLARFEGEGPCDPDPVEEVGGPPVGTTLPGVVEIGGTLLLGEGPLVALGGPPLLVCVKKKNIKINPV